MTRFVNEKRVARVEYEGFGEHRTAWPTYEVRCGDCNKWTRDYGEVSVQVGDNPDEHAWVCPACAAALETYPAEVNA